MSHVLAIATAVATVFYLLNDSGTVRLSGGTGSGASSGNAGASKSAIGGIAGSAG